MWTLGERKKHRDDGAIHGDNRGIGDGDKLAKLVGLNLAVRDITETP